MDIIIRNARISDKENLKDVAIKDGKILAKIRFYVKFVRNLLKFYQTLE